VIITQDQHSPKLAPGHGAGVELAIGEVHRYNHHLHHAGWNMSRSSVFTRPYVRLHDMSSKFSMQIQKICST
jgi:hypothetical protein